jgi:uncharacterized protein (TIGR02145 family)
MKTISLFVVSLLLVASLPCIAAINYKITFTGTGASTTVGDVVVQNLTKGTIVKVLAGNTLDLSDVVSAVEPLNTNDETVRVYPNVVGGVPTLSFFAKQAGVTQINVYSLDGRKVVSINQNLQPGNNSFQLSLPRGSFAIQAIGNEYTYSTKMINQNASLSQPKITYIGTEKPLSATPQKSKSSALATTTMLYNTGDRLLYKGTSGNYSTIVTDVPTAGKTINFDFVACTDADGNNYTTITIGTQTWMAENLRTSKYNNGTSIPNVTDNTAWEGLTTGACCNYSNLLINGTKYGHLYNGYAVIDNRKIAPIGWHIPSDSEWTTLTTFLGGESVAGSKMKETGSSNWGYFNTSATNESGFTALPSGQRSYWSTFYDGSSNWWSSTLWYTDNAWSRECSSGNDVYRSHDSNNSGLSVRCVRD